MPRIPPLALALCLALAASPATALLTRPDRDDSEYVELATRYPAAVRLEAGGSGALIAPRWVLTTATRARELRAAKGARVLAGSRSYDVQAVFPHPDARPGTGTDIALVWLRIPVEGVEPARVYRQRDEAGLAVRLVAHGPAARQGAKTPSSGGDGRARAGVNTVDAVEATMLRLKLKGPDDASDLQGAFGPGDRGGPAFFEIDGQAFVAGIGFATDDANGDGIEGNPGDWDLFVRVSAFAAWIDAVTAQAAADEAAALLGEPGQR